jgi:hypothetical protein
MTFVYCCAKTGRSLEAIAKNFGPNGRKFPGRSFDKHRQVAPDEMSVLFPELVTDMIPTDGQPTTDIPAPTPTDNVTDILPTPATDTPTPPQTLPTDRPTKRKQVTDTTPTTTPTTEHILRGLWRTEPETVCTMSAAMLGQMVHTGGFFWHNSPINHPYILPVLAVIFALGVDSTALIMTIKGKGRGYLIGFLIAHCLMNMIFHAQVHEFDISFSGMLSITAWMLLSVVLAYSNYSYTGLFSKK